MGGLGRASVVSKIAFSLSLSPSIIRGICASTVSRNSLYLNRCHGLAAYTEFRYNVFGYMVFLALFQILVLNFSDIWSFRLYDQLYQDKTVDYISEIRCT